jgi:hypothetical protein
LVAWTIPVNNQHSISRSIAVTSGNKYTASFFLKAAGYTTAAIRMGAGSLWTGGTGPTVEFDLVALTGTVVDGSGVTFTIEDYGNGWRRCSVTGTCVTSGNTAYSLYVKQYAGYIGNGTDGVYAWGGNITATGYATSYIPTLGAAVTRLADACSKTGISSLIGQTEGTLFVEGEAVTIDTSSNSPIYITVSNGNQNDICYIQQTLDGPIRVDYFAGGVRQARITSTTTYPLGTKIKAAFGYKSGDFVFYINGVLIGTETTGTSTAPLSKITIGAFETANFTGSAINQALLFKTRLSNAIPLLNLPPYDIQKIRIHRLGGD